MWAVQYGRVNFLPLKMGSRGEGCLFIVFISDVSENHIAAPKQGGETRHQQGEKNPSETGDIVY